MLVRGQKGFPLRGVRATGWSVFDRDVLMPAAVLLQSALTHNSTSFARYCSDNGVSFAPHGKTTMSPQLFDLQLRDGAWGVTAANAFQARTMIDHGVPRVLIANEVVAPGDVSWFASAIRRGHEVYSCVDSVAAVKTLDEGLHGRVKRRRAPVLVELGVTGGRTGCRSGSHALEVAEAVRRSSSLRLAGVSGFEGIISASAQESTETLVDRFLHDLRCLADDMSSRGLFADTDEVLLSAGGSVHFERVVAQLRRDRPNRRERVVVRSGCYLSHDDGVINELSPLGSLPRTSGDVFRAALEVWGVVLSRPEPDRVIIGVGKRDASTDGLLPVAKKRLRSGASQPEPWVSVGRATRVDDQHTYLSVEPDDDVAVGDLVGLGISHPCTTFDKWRAIPIVDDSYRVTHVAVTKF